MNTYLYPQDLIGKLHEVWSSTRAGLSDAPQLPPNDELRYLFDVAYHASFLTEEQRKLGFRLIYAPRERLREEIAERSEPLRSPHISLAEFSQARPFTTSELLRLAPATDYTRMLICVAPTEDKRRRRPHLEIWGLLDTGGSWWSFTHGEGHSGSPPPNYMTVSTTEPGHLAISREGWTLLNLRHGSLTIPSWSSPFHQGPVSKFLDPARGVFYKTVCSRLESTVWDETDRDDDYPKWFYSQCIERILFHIREKHHGGTLLMVPEDFAGNDSRLTDLANVKYVLDYSRLWNLSVDYLEAYKRYYELFFGPAAEDAVERETIHQLRRWDYVMDETDEALTDAVRFAASLSAVDGAVLMTRELKLIGFGVEIIAASQIDEVDVSSVPSGLRTSKLPIESHGTRHRSAIRFCSRYQDALAFIVSSDGGVKAVKRVGSKIIMWPDINSGVFGL